MAINPACDSILDLGHQFDEYNFSWDLEQETETFDANESSFFDDAVAFAAPVDDAFPGDDWLRFNTSSDVPPSCVGYMGLSSPVHMRDTSASSLSPVQQDPPATNLDDASKDMASSQGTEVDDAQASRFQLEELHSLGSLPSPCSVQVATKITHQPITTKSLRHERPRAHGFDSMIHTFQGMPSDSNAGRSRSSYEKGRRQEVAFMRKVKACTRCRREKLPVSQLKSFALIT